MKENQMSLSRFFKPLALSAVCVLPQAAFAIDERMVGNWQCSRSGFKSATTIDAAGNIDILWETKISGSYRGGGLIERDGKWEGKLLYFTLNGTQKTQDIDLTLEMDGDAEMRQMLTTNGARDVRMKCKR